jgi:ankyrin repeat protein
MKNIKIFITIVIGLTFNTYCMEEKVLENEKLIHNLEMRPTSHELIAAVKEKSKEKVLTILNAGADVNAVDTNSRTPLFWAVLKEQEDIVELLLRKGANIDATDRENITPLMVAVATENSNTVDLLLKSHPNINMQNNREQTALHAAVAIGNLGIVERLIKAGADITICQHGGTPLHIAAQYHNTKVLEYLIQVGTFVNVRDRNGQTPLMVAAFSGDNKTLDLLIKSGANINAQDQQGATALYAAVEKGHYTTAEHLIKAGADSNLGDNIRGATPLLRAIHYGHSPLVELLLREGADINARDNEGLTPLMVAVSGKNSAIIALLLKSRPYLNALNNDGIAALHIAIMQGNYTTAKLLIEAGADSNIANNGNGESALHLAGHLGHDKLVELLINKGANINYASADGDTPLMIAASSKRKEGILKLLEHKASINALSEQAITALSYAAVGGNTDIVEELLKYIPVEEKKSTLKSAFLNSLTYGHLELVNRMLAWDSDVKDTEINDKPLSDYLPEEAIELLKQQKSSVSLLSNQEDEDKRCEKAYPDICHLLMLCKNSDLSSYLKNPSNSLEHWKTSYSYERNEYHQTILIWASMFGHSAIVNHILTSLIPEHTSIHDRDFRMKNPKIDRALKFINAQDILGRTALMYAILYGYGTVAQALIPCCGSGINLKDQMGKTALTYAIQKGDIATINALVNHGATITAKDVKEAAEGNNYRIAVWLLGLKKELPVNLSSIV